MNYLLNAQAFLLFEKGDTRLPENIKNIIQSDKHAKYISIASFWEITIKQSLGKLNLHIPFKELCGLKGYSILNIEIYHLLNLQNLPYHHRDPFDRIIIAQS